MNGYYIVFLRNLEYLQHTSTHNTTNEVKLLF